MYIILPFMPSPLVHNCLLTGPVWWASHSSISKSESPQCARSTLPADIAMSRNEDFFLVQFSPKTWSPFFTFSPIPLPMYFHKTIVLWTLTSQYSQYFLTLSLLFIHTVPSASALPWIVAITQWLLMEHYFLLPTENACQWMEILLWSWVEKGVC